jgi:putative Mn2+ efflux pump MntP
LFGPVFACAHRSGVGTGRIFNGHCYPWFIHKRVSLSQVSKLSLSFGSFHVVIPILGGYLSVTVVRFVAAYDHWAAFLLLAFVGGQMIYGATKEKRIEVSKIVNGLTLVFFSGCEY